MKKSNIFWISYSDLMTSLFFIMLVLFVISIGYLKSVLNATESQLNKIKEVQKAAESLPKVYFEYQDAFRRYVLKRDIEFETEKSIIKQKDIPYLIDVGKSINLLFDSLSNNPDIDSLDIKYLLVIEGMASLDNYERNFELSYARALSLYKLWKNNNIKFDPSICEVQIAGSGTDGIREYCCADERKNQRFLINIVPKIGNIDENKSK